MRLFPKQRKKAADERGLLSDTEAGLPDELTSSRKTVALRASLALLAVGAACGYAATTTIGKEQAAAAEDLEADYSFNFDFGDEDEAPAPYIPPFSAFDQDGNGVVTPQEFHAHLARVRDKTLGRLQRSSLSEEEKERIAKRVHENYDTELGCSTRMAERDRKRRGELGHHRLPVFYSLMKEFCTIHPIDIPEEYALTDKPENEESTEEPSTTTGPVDVTPTVSPTEPTEGESEQPTEEVTFSPSETDMPTSESTDEVTEETTEYPTEEPTEAFTEVPTEEPTEEATEYPTEEPSEESTEAPTEEETEYPTEEPTEAFTEVPTEEATDEPTESATYEPVTEGPVETEEPTEGSTEVSTEYPTEEATEEPTESATYEPVTEGPVETEEPTEGSTEVSTEYPTEEATEEPTEASTEHPTEEATEEPTEESTEHPTEEATEEPTEGVTEAVPTDEFTDEPTSEFTQQPTEEATEYPTVKPTQEVTEEPEPTEEPTQEVTETVTVEPTNPTTQKPVVKKEELEEGDSIKCYADDDVYFRFIDGKRWLYPSEEIAHSWGFDFEKYEYVDCNTIPLGGSLSSHPDREHGGSSSDVSLTPIEDVQEGQFIKCYPDDGSVYLVKDGTRRRVVDLEPKEVQDFSVVDCHKTSRGNDIQVNAAPESIADFTAPNAEPRSNDEGWKTVPGVLKQLSFDGNQLCGVNFSDYIFCATENIRGEGSPNWRQLPGKLKHISVHRDRLYGVNSLDQIFIGSAHGDPKWERTPGRLAQISGDMKQSCGVNKGNQIWCSGAYEINQINWRLLPGALTNVQVRGKYLFGTNRNSQLYMGKSSGDPQWKMLDKSLHQVSFDGRTLCGVGDGETVHCAFAVLSNPQWSSFGQMRSVSVHGRDLFAVRPDGTIHYRKLDQGAVDAIVDVPEGWTRIPGSLDQLSTDGQKLCGVNFQDDIFCADTNITGEGEPNWRQLVGKLKHVDVLKDRLVGVNIFDGIFVGSSHGDPKWGQVPGALSQVSTDGKQLCGVNSDDRIFCTNEYRAGFANWRQLEGALRSVEVHNGRLFGANRNNQIWQGRSLGPATWTHVSGSLRQVSFDGKTLCGVNETNDVHCAFGAVNGLEWHSFGKMSYVAVEGQHLYGVDPYGQIFYRSLPTELAQPGPVEKPGWKTIPGRLAQISYDGKQLCGVNSKDEIFCANRNIQGVQEQAPGACGGVFDGCGEGKECKVRFKSWKGDYLHRPDSAQGVTTWHTGVGNEWAVQCVDGKELHLKSWKNDFLHRPDSNQGVTTWHTGHGNIWSVERIQGNQIRLRSWKSDYLHRPDSNQGVTTWHTGVGNEWFVEWISAKPEEKSMPNWRQLPGKLTHVSVSGNQLYGVNAKDQIYFSASSSNPEWVPLPGALRQISGDGKQICGVNAGESIFCADSYGSNKANWRQLPGALTNVEVRNGHLFGSNNGRSVFQGKSVGSPDWHQVSESSFKQVSFDGKRACGINEEGLWCGDYSNLPDTWHKYGTNFEYVSANGDDVYALDLYGHIYYRHL